MRRGVESANSRWDNSTAILAGDFLFAHSSMLLADLGPEAVQLIAQTFAEIAPGCAEAMMARARDYQAQLDALDTWIEQSVHLAAADWWVERRSADRIDLVAEGGLGLDRLVRETAACGWFGLEALAEIPGTVGAAPVQNVGAYGVELGDRIRWVEAWDRHAGALRCLAHDECDFGYRRSRFKREAGRWLILRVGLRLSNVPPANWPPVDYPGLSAALADWQEATGRRAAEMSPLAYADMITRVRLAKLPDWRSGLPGSVGSFFHNPVVAPSRAQALAERWPTMPQFVVEDGVKIPAGWLIEQAGLRGYRDGPVGVSARHALVLEHHGGASGEEFVGFAKFVQTRVRELFGIELVCEPERVME